MIPVEEHPKPEGAAMNLWLRHPVLRLQVWWAPRVRGAEANPLTMTDVGRLQRLLGYLEDGARDF